MNYTLITDFFKNYGWQLFLLALSGIVVLGLLKWFGCFKKLKTDKKKYVYFGLSALFSIIACTIYLFCTNTFNWVGFGVLCPSVIGLTSVVYNIYEYTGVRALWKKLVLNPIAKLFKLIISSIVSGTMSKEKLQKLAMELGSEVLTNLTLEARKIEAEKNK